MMTFRHVSRINVSLWGARVGTIVESPQRGGSWELSPAYDLTGATFPSEDPWSAQAGVHQLSVNGKRKDIAESDLLAVADRFGIGTAKRVLSEVRAALSA